jgi:hypothetical protein
VNRMRWARAVAGELFASPSAPARQSLPGPGHTARGQPPAMAAGRVMRRIRAGRPGIRRERVWTEEMPAGPRDPDVVRAKALTRARRTGSSRASQAQQAPSRALGHTPAPGNAPVCHRRTGPVKAHLSGGRRPPSLSVAPYVPGRPVRTARQDCGDRSP